MKANQCASLSYKIYLIGDTNTYFSSFIPRTLHLGFFRNLLTS